jgi:hypothetical protein
MVLGDIRREWTLSSDETTAQAQNKAVEALAKWLVEQQTSRNVALRVVQTMLADPEEPGIERHTSIQSCIEPVVGTWATAGVGSKGLQGLQAMLLAAFPTDAGAAADIVPLLESAWAAVKGRVRAKPRIERWRRQLAAPTLYGAEKSLEPLSNAPKLKKTAKLAEFPEPDPDFQHLEANASVNWYFSNFSRQLVNVLRRHGNGLQAVAAGLAATSDGVQVALDEVYKRVRLALAIQNRAQATQNLLWWGQAKYSYSLSSPFRSLNGIEQLWWLAWEAAQLSVTVEIESAASYLVEVVHQLNGVSKVKKPLSGWLEELVKFLSSAQKMPGIGEFIALSPTLRELAEEDALGLPVTWVRLRAGTGFSADEAREAVALDLDTPVTRDDWVVWLFRELLLDRRLRGA